MKHVSKNIYKKNVFIIMFMIFFATFISSFFVQPKHALMITTRTTSSPFGFDTFGHQRQVLEPLFIQRFHKEENLDGMVEEEKNKQTSENSSKMKTSIIGYLYNNMLFRLTVLAVTCCLFFFIGYHTRKSQEDNSYVRLPTKG